MLRLELLFFLWVMVIIVLLNICCVAVVSLMGWLLWYSLYFGDRSLLISCTGWKSAFFSSLAWSMYVFPVALFSRTGCGFSPVVSYIHWYIWDCIIRLGIFSLVIVFAVTPWGYCRFFGVVFSMRGPRTTQESFPNHTDGARGLAFFSTTLE